MTRNTQKSNTRMEYTICKMMSVIMCSGVTKMESGRCLPSLKILLLSELEG